MPWSSWSAASKRGEGNRRSDRCRRRRWRSGGDRACCKFGATGGNITGISDNATTLSTKRLELLKQTKPNIHKVAMLWNKDDLGMTLRYEASANAAKSLGSAVQPLGVREPDDFADAFTTMDRDLPDAILMVADALTILNRKRVFDLRPIVCQRSTNKISLFATAA